MNTRAPVFILMLAFSACADYSDPLAIEPVHAAFNVSHSGAVQVDLTTWASSSYAAVSGFGAGNWNVASDGSSVVQTVNGQPTLFYSDFDAFKTEVTGVIRVNTTSDDDFIGFVLGFQPGDTDTPAADYLLVDWKKGTQSFDFGSPSCTPGSVAAVGLSVSRVFGIPTADELWGHRNFDALCSDLDSGVEELARANTLGSTSWASFTDYEFSFQFTATLLRVYVNGELEVEIDGDFSNGRLGFYNFSQAQVNYSAFTVATFNNAPAAQDEAHDINEDEELEVDAAAGVLANDSDPDADPLTALLVAGPAHGALTLNADGSFTYTPNPDYHGADGFTYIASDGDLESDPATVSVTIHPVNDGPTAVAGGSYEADEGSAITFDGGDSVDVDGDALTYQWDFGDGASAVGVSTAHAYADDGTYPVTLSVSDGTLNDLAVTAATIVNVAPQVEAPIVPAAPVQLGTQVNVSATFADPGTGDAPFSAAIHWGDGTTTGATITESGGAGTAAGSHIYAVDGMYMVTIEVTDKDGGLGMSEPADVVVYNPEASVSGRGTIDSPPGAYAADGGMTGSARFSFVSRYRKGATVPSGRTDFVFRIADFRFVSAAYDWLVVAGPRAQFKGSGTVNGAGDYGFMLTAIDGDQPGGDGEDRFRIKIWDRVTGNVLYDNESGMLDDGDPATRLTRGRIVIRK
jgi:hypothetical protein